MGGGPDVRHAELRGHERLRLDGSLAVRGDVGTWEKGKGVEIHSFDHSCGSMKLA